MKHAAALAILVTMAATPLTTLACVGWCFPATVPANTACHHHAQAAAGAGIRGADDSCTRLFTFSPFVREETQLTAPAADSAGAPQASFTVAAGEARPVPVHDVAAAVPHRAISSLALRL